MAPETKSNYHIPKPKVSWGKNEFSIIALGPNMFL